MEFLRKLMLQTKVHLQGLTTSQKLAIGSSVLLIAVAIFALVQWAAAPAMVALLDQPLGADESSRIQQFLDSAGIKYEVIGDVVRVPIDQRPRLLAQLTQQRLLPNDISLGFTKLIGEASNPWLPMQEQDRRWNVARCNELARVLREFTGIRDARVFVETATRRHVGQPNAQPTASVSVKLADGVALDKGLVRAIAGFVSSAVSNLSIHNVTVADSTSGRAASVPKPEDGMDGDDIDRRKVKEEYFANQIRELLSDIPVSVKVYCELEPESRQQIEEVYSKPVISTESTTSETDTTSTLAGEPGVVPNATVSVGGGVPVSNLEKTSSEMTYKSEVDKKVIQTRRPPDTIKSLSASVNIPKSYLVNYFKLSKDPTDQELDTMSTSLRDKIKKSVMTCLAISPDSEDRVTVDWFPDAGALAMAQIGSTGAGEGVMGMVSNHWDKAGMAALAVLGLLMMLMMVRKVGEGPVLPGEEPPTGGRKKGLPVAEVEEEVPVSEARESEPLLIGKEVDEETLRAQQIVQQVGELIKGDPASSAGILQRWIEEAGA